MGSHLKVAPEGEVACRRREGKVARFHVHDGGVNPHHGDRQAIVDSRGTTSGPVSLLLVGPGTHQAVYVFLGLLDLRQKPSGGRKLCFSFLSRYWARARTPGGTRCRGTG